MTRLVVHVGDPKTGTSALQRAFFFGMVDAPKGSLAYWRRLNANDLVRPLKARGRDTGQTAWQHLPGWLSDCGPDTTAVISAELFSSADPRALDAALRRHVPGPGDEALIVCYVRPHLDRFLAAYMQRIKTGGIFGTMDEFEVQSDQIGLLEFGTRLRAWREVFGKRLVVRPFLRDRLRGGDVVEDFLHVIRPDGAFRLKRQVRFNESTPVRALAGLRPFHSTLSERGVDRPTRHTIGAAIAHWPLKSASVEKPWMSAEMAGRLRDRCVADAAMLDAEFFGGEAVMVPALDRNADAARDTPMQLEPELHFSPDEMGALLGHAEWLAAKLASRDLDWPAHYRAAYVERRPAYRWFRHVVPGGLFHTAIDRRIGRIAQMLRG
ncbi:hypothetical protein E2L08_05480 [Palleronia sediminis]|uniref:Uncharacterized protein n=1 Tax=Palleronia sediminis TaxID=2547833 RepID=A0A4R6ACM0_9RHOB|nr:hypothetical protein [Palleronia sediminis]TDL81570.1 hypothetical protein E2L08_05480 [Palleronia sediminis]